MCRHSKRSAPRQDPLHRGGRSPSSRSLRTASPLTASLCVLLLQGSQIACAPDSAWSGRALSALGQDIVGGQPEPGFPAVGALMEQGEAFCTGTLVTSTVVVTAAHCVADMSASGMSFFIGADANNAGAGQSLQVIELRAHSGFSWDGDADDIGVLRLAAAAPFAPLPYLRQPMGADYVGQRPLFVGYGVTSTSADQAGVKHSVRIPIEQVMATTFRYADPSANTCWGDSGGPALLEVAGVMTLLGVTSWGDDRCAEFGVNTRVDTYEGFIQGFIDGAQGGQSDDGGGDVGVPIDGADYCAEQGWYDDGICDPDCARPDPDCSAGGVDVCAQEGWYGDGICDPGCPAADPDCAGQLPPSDDDGAVGDDGTAAADEDFCAVAGWYDDGLCDPHCPQPDPDCEDEAAPSPNVPEPTGAQEETEDDVDPGAAGAGQEGGDVGATSTPEAGAETAPEAGLSCAALGSSAAGTPQAALLLAALLLAAGRRRRPKLQTVATCNAASPLTPACAQRAQVCRPGISPRAPSAYLDATRRPRAIRKVIENSRPAPGRASRPGPLVTR